MRITSFVLFGLLAFIPPTFADPSPSPSTNGWVESQLLEMSVEEKIGQVLLIGVNGTENNSFNKRKFRLIRPGGVIFFGRNIKSATQISQFIADLSREARETQLPPLFFAVDQEGGSVTRLKSWPPMPSAAAVGRANDLNLAFKLSFFSGQVLRTLGFNLNLAPVLDLSDPFQKSFIGSRSFGPSPEAVARLGSAFISGYTTAGIATVAKHFPGHGGMISDSHQTTPRVLRTLPQLQVTDLVPFAQLQRASLLPGVMVAHLAYPKIETSGLPATYSNLFVDDVLRRSLNFEGLVFTDDLEMLGAKGIRSPGERAVRAFQAGADVIMVAWNPNSQEKAFQGLWSAVRSGRISLSRLNASVRRILLAKERFHIESNFTAPSPKELEVLVHHRELHSTIDQIVAKNISLSLVDNSTQLFSFDREVVLFSDDPGFSRAITEKIGAGRTHSYQLSPKTSPEAVAHQAMDFPRHYLVLLYASTQAGVRLINRLPRALKNRAHLITSEMPASVRRSSDFKSVFFSYTRHPQLGNLFYSALSRNQVGRDTASEEDPLVRKSDQ